MYTHRPSQGNRCYLYKKIFLTHWSDLSMDDRAIGGLPNERLAIECLPTSSATMTKKRTKSVLRSTFSNFGSAVPVFVENSGSNVFFCLVLIFLEKNVGSTLLFTKAQQRFCSCSVVLSFPHRSRLKIWIVTLHCDSALVTTPVVVRRVVVQVPAAGFFPPDRQLRSSLLLVIPPPARSRDGRCDSVLLSWRLLLSIGLLSIVDLRASFLLHGSLVQDDTALSKLEIWL